MPLQEELRLPIRKSSSSTTTPKSSPRRCNALQAEGALTQTCGDGNTAVRICAERPPELVVLDMMLPKRSPASSCSSGSNRWPRPPASS